MLYDQGGKGEDESQKSKLVAWMTLSVSSEMKCVSFATQIYNRT